MPCAFHSGCQGDQPEPERADEIPDGSARLHRRSWRRAVFKNRKDQIYQTSSHRPLCDYSYRSGTAESWQVAADFTESVSGDRSPVFECVLSGGGVSEGESGVSGRKEKLFSSFKVLVEEGYLKVANVPSGKKEEDAKNAEEKTDDIQCDAAFLACLQKLKKGAILPVDGYEIKEGETSPPKRYNSGTMILAMENAGQLIEDEELRAQIKGSGIGTSATRAEILKKLVNIKYISLNKKTQVITPTQLGEMIYEVVNASIRAIVKSGAYRELGERAELCSRGKYYFPGIYG